MMPVDTMVQKRLFGNAKVREALDAMTEVELVYAIGDADTVIERYASAPGWSPGDDRPELADDDPAVMAALARCASSRTRWGVPAAIDFAHRDPCGWCDWPLEQLIAACSWSVWYSRDRTTSLNVWLRDPDASPSSTDTYWRQAGALGPTNPAYRAFDELPRRDRESRVLAAVAASRS